MVNCLHLANNETTGAMLLQKQKDHTAISANSMWSKTLHGTVGGYVDTNFLEDNFQVRFVSTTVNDTSGLDDRRESQKSLDNKKANSTEPGNSKSEFRSRIPTITVDSKAGLFSNDSLLRTKNKNNVLNSKSESTTCESLRCSSCFTMSSKKSESLGPSRPSITSSARQKTDCAASADFRKTGAEPEQNSEDSCDNQTSDNMLESDFSEGRSSGLKHALTSRLVLTSCIVLGICVLATVTVLFAKGNFGTYKSSRGNDDSDPETTYLVIDKSL